MNFELNRNSELNWIKSSLHRDVASFSSRIWDQHHHHYCHHQACSGRDQLPYITHAHALEIPRSLAPLMALSQWDPGLTLKLKKGIVAVSTATQRLNNGNCFEVGGSLCRTDVNHGTCFSNCQITIRLCRVHAADIIGISQLSRFGHAWPSSEWPTGT